MFEFEESNVPECLFLLPTESEGLHFSNFSLDESSLLPQSLFSSSFEESSMEVTEKPAARTDDPSQKKRRVRADVPFKRILASMKKHYLRAFRDQGIVPRRKYKADHDVLSNASKALEKVGISS